MKARGRLVVLACALAAVLALPDGAVAKPGYYVSTPQRISVISLKGSNGYRVELFALNSRHVTLFAHKPFGSGGSVSYSVRGRVTDDRIDARFGGLGRVSLRLEPSPAVEVEESQAGCKGRASVTRRGRFTGTVRFRGERGFTRIGTRSAHGFVSRSFRQVCRRSPEPGSPPERSRVVSLSAISGRAPTASWFSAFKEDRPRPGRSVFGDEAEYTANVAEKQEGVTIVRSAQASDAPETFAVSPAGTRPATATVSPPFPFSGTATYEKDASGKVSWTGDLAVELPGRGAVPLAAPGYRAKLCRSFACACPVGFCGFIIATESGGSRELQRLRQLASRVHP